MEIGVEYGRTFESVKIPHKWGIDPKFRFHKFFQTKITLFEMESDSFFINNQLPKLDLVFIDGLHTKDQTMKDFKNIFPFLHKRSIVVMDDTVPSDPSSALPTPSEAYEHRKISGVVNNFNWHGDVFKCVGEISNQYPYLKFNTIEDLRNPISVFWGFQKSEYVNFESKTIEKLDQKMNLWIKDFPKIPREMKPLKKSEFFREVGHDFANL